MNILEKEDQRGVSIGIDSPFVAEEMVCRKGFFVYRKE